MLERCRKRLEEAWYLYHCSNLSREALQGIHWRLTQENSELFSFLVCVFRSRCQKELLSCMVLEDKQMDDKQVAVVRQRCGDIK